MIDVIIIACNTVSGTDGIGKHASIIAKALKDRDDVGDVSVISGNTVGFSSVRKVLSLRMSLTIFRAMRILNKKSYGVVIVEYPFDEFSPFIVSAFGFLKLKCKSKGTVLALSMHEYDRVKKLRKAVIRCFVKWSDIVFVSEPHYCNTLKQYNQNISVRTIFNTVPVPTTNPNSMNDMSFVYFGFINKSKAFYEVLDAWDVFNEQGRYLLNIITGSEVTINESEHKNIKLYRNVPDNDVSSLLSQSAFGIVPAKPAVGFNNSTFITLIQCGCIPIGRFDKNTKDLEFTVDFNSYDIPEIVYALNKCTEYGLAEIAHLSNQAFEFGKQFSADSSAEMMISAIKKDIVFDYETYT